MPEIMVLRGGAVGDFVLTLPVLGALRDKWPGGEITVAAYPRIKRLVLESGLADRFESLDSPQFAALFSVDALAGGLCAGMFGEYDVVLSYLHDPEHVLAANLMAAGGRRTICASPMIAGGHACDVLCRPLSELGIAAPPIARPELTLKPSTMQKGAVMAAAMGPRVLMIHPGSGGMTKNWPWENYVDLHRKIRESGTLTPVFSFGEADGELRGRIMERLPGAKSVEGLDLADLAALLAACAGYLGNDSGITHLAAAVGVPTIAIFGPTDPSIWGPRGKHVTVIRAQGPMPSAMANVSVEEVVNKIIG